MRKLALLAAPALMLLVSACGAVINGTDQVVRLEIEPKGLTASCLATNTSGAWTAQHAPQHVTISRSHAPLRVECVGHNGWRGAILVDSSFMDTLPTGDAVKLRYDAEHPVANYVNGEDVRVGLLERERASQTFYPSVLTVRLAPVGK